MRELIVEADSGASGYWRDIWRYRELFYFFAWRDILVRYKQTVAGVAWSVIRPAITLTVLTIVFGRVAGLPSQGVPYPLLVFCGMLPWQFFASALNESGSSLVTHGRLISKTYFPRLLVPASSIIPCFIDLLIGGALLSLMMAYYRVAPTATIFALPLFLALGCLTAFGAGLWISALMVRYRDFKVISLFIAQFGLYLSPIGFTSAVITERFLPPDWKLLYWINPMAGVIDGFRWSLLGATQTLYWPGVLVSIGSMAVLALSGLRYFRRSEDAFADVI